MSAPVVIKVSGHEIADPAFLTEFATVIREMTQPVVIVHGGGKEISTMQEKLGLTPQYVDGVRVTDATSLSIVTMILCGTVNTRLVRYLVDSGVDALGLSGVDRGLIRAEQMAHPTVDMGFTGEVVAVRSDLLLEMIASGITPVIAPICLGDDRQYNVNADHVAGAVAAALDAERIVFLTNVEGVMQDGVVLPQLTAVQVDVLRTKEIIYGGMIPKVETALHALRSGVQRAVITNLTGLRQHGGTIFLPDTATNSSE